MWIRLALKYAGNYTAAGKTIIIVGTMSGPLSLRLIARPRFVKCIAFCTNALNTWRTGSLIALLVMSISKTTSFTVLPFVQLQRSYYVLEGMAQRIQFLISADRELYGAPQQLNVDNYSEYDTDRYLPDAVPHYMDYYGTPIVFTIQDAAGPVNLQGTNFQQALQQFQNFVDEENDFTDLLEDLNYIITDYIDTDDSPTDPNSWEADEYYDAGMSPLPRNGAITSFYFSSI